MDDIDRYYSFPLWKDDLLGFSYMSNGIMITLSIVLLVFMFMHINDLHVLRLVLRLSKLIYELCLILNMYPVGLILSGMTTHTPGTSLYVIVYSANMHFINALLIMSPVLILAFVISTFTWIRIWYMGREKTLGGVKCKDMENAI